jgi:hypothetical protein
MAVPLLGRRPKRKSKPPKPCMTAGCGTVIPCWRWLCDGCFKQLPFARRKAIAEACEERAPQRIYGLCRDAAEWLVEQRLKRVEG